MALGDVRLHPPPFRLIQLRDDHQVAILEGPGLDAEIRLRATAAGARREQAGGGAKHGQHRRGNSVAAADERCDQQGQRNGADA
jgi:hypothetical protein